MYNSGLRQLRPSGIGSGLKYSSPHRRWAQLKYMTHNATRD